MHSYTALYERREDAVAIQDQLEKLGIIETDRAGVHGRDMPGYTDTPTDAGYHPVWDATEGAIPPHEDRHVYEESLKRGGYMLTVNVDDQYADRVHELLENSNAVNVEEREREYRDAGLMPLAGAAAATTAMATPRETERVGGDETIKLVEEQLRVGKRQVDRGGVRVRSYVVETPVHEQVSLRQERVEIERRPVNEPLSTAHGDVFRDRELSATERSEEAVVAKDARIVEELSIRKDVQERVEHIEDSVRKTEVEVEQIASSDRTVTDRTVTDRTVVQPPR